MSPLKKQHLDMHIINQVSHLHEQYKGILGRQKTNKNKQLTYLFKHLSQKEDFTQYKGT